jgi:hypothetical protein
VPRRRVDCVSGGALSRCVCLQVVTVNGRNYVELARANCEAQGDCLYSGIVSVTSTSGSVLLDIRRPSVADDDGGSGSGDDDTYVYGS